MARVRNFFYGLLQMRRHYARLAEIGRFQELKTSGKYEPGQLFLHRIFGYRGVILFTWTARVYDRDKETRENEKSFEENGSFNPGKEIKAETQTYYQALIDNRDSPFIPPMQVFLGEFIFHACSTKNNIPFPLFYLHVIRGQKAFPVFHEDRVIIRLPCGQGQLSRIWKVQCDWRAQPEIVTFLGYESDNALYSIPGLDYISQEDVLPYTVSDAFSRPIHHELFDKFLYPEPGKVLPFAPREALQAWQEKNHKWLELTDVHRETHSNVRITVMPFYMGTKNNLSSQDYWWRYCIRIENLGQEIVQLRERHWRIFSLSGTLETVRGRGVVGQEPVLSPQQPAFQYSSHVSLQAPSGNMWGKFRFERSDGSMFETPIPPFALDSRKEDTPEPPRTT